jgi:polyphosphate kinase
VGFKTHCKLALVIRREGNVTRRYVHIGTGNYHPSTARLYTDLGLFTCREDVTADVSDLFNHLTGFARPRSYRRLFVAPVDLRDRIVGEIAARWTSTIPSGRHGW